MSSYVCSAHHRPVTAKGKGCPVCARERRQWIRRRNERRAASRALQARKASGNFRQTREEQQ